MKNDLANLDVLRAFAVLLVALGHFLMYAGKGGWCGWMGLTGVCLFFVHTCLVLMWSLERDPHTGRFYVRRFFRLFPLWLVVLAFVVATHLPVSPVGAPAWNYLAPSPLELLANATMTFNLWFGARIVGASWSLPVEAQMYLLLPLLFFFIRSARALWVLLLLDALAIASAWAGNAPNPVATLANCIPYFLPGVMAYLLAKTVKPVLPAWTFVAFLLAAAAIHHRFGNLFLSAFFCLGVGLALPFFRQITWQPMVRSAHLIARYSYGIYLCHIPAICLGLHFLRGFPTIVRLLSIPLSLTVASVTLYHVVEAPMVRFGARLAELVQPVGDPQVRSGAMGFEPAP